MSIGSRSERIRSYLPLKSRRHGQKHETTEYVEHVPPGFSYLSLSIKLEYTGVKIWFIYQLCSSPLRGIVSARPATTTVWLWSMTGSTSAFPADAVKCGFWMRAATAVMAKDLQNSLQSLHVFFDLSDTSETEKMSDEPG